MVVWTKEVAKSVRKGKETSWDAELAGWKPPAALKPTSLSAKQSLPKS
jgi:hypothetical protein